MMQPLSLTAWLAALTLSAGVAQAQGFAASVSPPRVELATPAGQTVRQVLDINHASLQSGRYRVYTNDWVYQKDGTVAFSDELLPGSCRPWVALERRDLTIAAKGRHRFRVEVTVPALSPNAECRFAVMIEGQDPVQVQQEGIAMPVSGRIAVIVYVAVGDAKAKLSVAAHRTLAGPESTVALLDVKNAGNATGRLDGVLEAVDADGVKVELMPSNMPILPGETRSVALAPLAPEGKAPPLLKYPLKVRGTLEIGKERLPLDLTFAPPP